ncbi:MAG TPA: DEAD/DEAH box helicase [Thermoanaerobaculia bacterium]|nr:DEAD/DEAH box helicase [Thermoanaerobaculia bacterium]
MTETPELTFAQLGLRDSLLETLTALGYEVPTPIQGRTIPVLLAGSDLIGQAQTGTGKTAAFALPILQKLDASKKETQALILAPTRELAMQVAEAVHSYARGMDVSVLPVYGGAPIVLQMKHLQRGVQVVVGTPGRLIDHLDRGTLRLDAVRMVVLDEADEMLKMGFIEEVERILSEVPAPRQVALFSATMPAEVVRIAQRHLIQPVRVEIEHHALTTPDIEQRFVNLSEGQKLDVLTRILELEPSEAALIFRRTKTGAAELAEKLEARGFAAVAMHGDMAQSLRESVIRRLRAGQIEIVVATDVAARGLDVEQISHVINYDVPYDVEAYVHRIGRTGRAGRSGVATLFITPRERRMMREIERFTGSAMKPMKIPTPADVAARRMALFKESLRKNVEEGDLDLYVGLVEQLAEEGPFDIADIAAAAARLASGGRSFAPAAETAPILAPAPERERERPVGERLRARTHVHERSHAAADSRPRPAMSSEPKVRLSMAVGKRDGIRPADIVGSIANEADVPGRDIGPIDIRDEITIVVIPEKYRDQVLAKVAGKRFRGRPLDVQLAGDSPAPRPSARYEHAERPAGHRPERRDSPRPPAPYAKRPHRETFVPDRTRRTARPSSSFDRDSGGPAHREGKKPFYATFAKGGKPPRPGKPGGGPKRPDGHGPKEKKRPR